MDFLGQHQDWVHRHLDWQGFRYWLRDPANWIYLLWDENQIHSVMAFCPPLGQATWLRMFGTHPQNQTANFMRLWEVYQTEAQGKIHLVAVMASQAWLQDLLQEIGFEHTETVINLSRTAQAPPHPPPSEILVRPVRWREGRHVLAIDHAAFEAPWQIEDADLQSAGRRAYHYTVALIGGRLVGYQLSMRYGKTLHLGRLATLPDCRNLGVGSALLHDLASHAELWGIDWMTVNTQESNAASRHLYERFGFQRDYGDIPIYTFRL